MSGLAKQVVSWLRSQSDMTHTSLSVVATAALVPVIPSLSPPALATLNLSTMAIQFGTQSYVAMVGGPTMFLNLPRATFGNLQSRLFPKMGMVCMCTGALTLASYNVHHGADTAMYLLTSSLVCNILNSFFLFPKTTDLMFELRKYEEGTEERKKAGMRFGIWHAICNIVNLGSMIANFGYIYVIASKVAGQW